MTGTKLLIIEPFGSIQDRSGFDCGVEGLNRYLKQQAKQDMKRRISRVYVAVRPNALETIVGYYTLSSLPIDLDRLPEALSKKLPKHPIPAALIGKLAVHKDAQGSGIGKMLLGDAVKRTMAVSNEIAIYALVVDAVNDNAMDFYASFGFEFFMGETRRLFLPLKSL